MTLDPAFQAFALELADAARDELRSGMQAGPAVHVKADSTLVTDLDRAVEDRLRRMIEARFPDHGIVGEEHGSRDPDARFVWVLDPIDGTAQFIAGFPVFGTLIALAENGVPVLGVVDHPMTDERWVGVRDAATTCNEMPVRTRPAAEMGAAILNVGSPDHFDAETQPALDALKAMVRWTVYGGSCYAYAQLASGRIDLAFDDGLGVYDFCALVPVIEGAGGVITDWQGRPLTLERSGQVLAAGSAELHGRALEVLQEHVCEERNVLA
jgi:inositol-phosphate phosphatase/L-galactose 1-phosphate phosphatase/histidinol-phosphatase